MGDIFSAGAEGGASPETPARAVFLDVLGTTVALLPPWDALHEALGGELDPDAVKAAAKEEIHYYAAHCHEAGDEASLADLRRRCAELLSDRLGTEVSVETMLGAMRFAPYPDAVTALPALRERGLRLYAVTNWDISVREVLERVGLAELLDGVVCSADLGVRKPDPAPFRRALELAGLESGEVLHVGDSAEEDVAGAGAAGIRAVLIDREGGGDIASLEEVADRV